MTPAEQLRAKRFNEAVRSVYTILGNSGLALIAAGIAQLFPGGLVALALLGFVVGSGLVVLSIFTPYLMIAEE